MAVGSRWPLGLCEAVSRAGPGVTGPLGPWPQALSALAATLGWRGRRLRGAKTWGSGSVAGEGQVGRVLSSWARTRQHPPPRFGEDGTRPPGTGRTCGGPVGAARGAHAALGGLSSQASNVLCTESVSDGAGTEGHRPRRVECGCRALGPCSPGTRRGPRRPQRQALFLEIREDVSKSCADPVCARARARESCRRSACVHVCLHVHAPAHVWACVRA